MRGSRQVPGRSQLLCASLLSVPGTDVRLDDRFAQQVSQVLQRSDLISASPGLLIKDIRCRMLVNTFTCDALAQMGGMSSGEMDRVIISRWVQPAPCPWGAGPRGVWSQRTSQLSQYSFTGRKINRMKHFGILLVVLALSSLACSRFQVNLFDTPAPAVPTPAIPGAVPPVQPPLINSPICQSCNWGMNSGMNTAGIPLEKSPVTDSMQPRDSVRR